MTQLCRNCGLHSQVQGASEAEEQHDLVFVGSKQKRKLGGGKVEGGRTGEGNCRKGPDNRAQRKRNRV